MISAQDVEAGPTVIDNAANTSEPLADGATANAAVAVGTVGPEPSGRPERRRLPVVISFWAGAPYYRQAAELLRADCKRLGIDHEIEELDVPSDFDWAQICRKKVEFYERKLKELKCPVMWVDVDCRLRAIPDFLKNPGWDFAAILRGCSELDPYRLLHFARTWVPSVVVFNHTPMGLAMVETMAREAHRHHDEATDDYFLEEAWRKHRAELVALPIPPTFVDRDGDRPDAAIVLGHSGNVKAAKAKVDQHPNDKLANLKARLVAEAAADVADPDVRRQLLRRAWSRDVSDFEVMLALVRHARAVEPQLAAEILLRASGIFPRKHQARRMLFDLFMQTDEPAKAKTVARELAASDDEEARSMGRALLADAELEERATRAGLAKRDRVPVWWMKGPYPGNFGDILNPYLIEKMTGTVPRYTQQRGHALLAVGSVIKFAEKGTRVWGTGCSRRSDLVDPGARYHAVRGPITHDIVRRSGGYCDAIYGDPALLLPSLYDPVVPKRHRLGYIPHLVHRDVKVETDAKVIDVRRASYDDIEAFIVELKECEAVVSTSLHGIIVANAYGIPARWATFSTSAPRLSGDDMKFEDYFLGAGMPVQAPLDLSERPVLDSGAVLRSMDRTVDLKVRLDLLRDAFPWDLIPQTTLLAAE